MCVVVKLNVVQKRWHCALACTSFNFTKRWLSVLCFVRLFIVGTLSLGIGHNTDIYATPHHTYLLIIKRIIARFSIYSLRVSTISLFKYPFRVTFTYVYLRLNTFLHFFKNSTPPPKASPPLSYPSK